MMEQRGFRVEQPSVYESLRVGSLSGALIDAVSANELDGVLLMSPFTAWCWVELVSEAGVSAPAARLRHYCLSADVAAGLDGLTGVRVAAAENPDEDDLLALIDRETAD